MLKTADCKDTWVASALWGRVGASVLVLASVVLGAWGVEFSGEEQAAAYESVAAILASIGALMALVSKWRETQRQPDCVDDSVKG